MLYGLGAFITIQFFPLHDWWNKADIPNPHIIDINDGISMFNNQYKKRLSHYTKNKYDITIFNIDGTKEKYKTKSKKSKKNINLEECLID
mgnify:CR=1 FL=1